MRVVWDGDCEGSLEVRVDDREAGLPILSFECFPHLLCGGLRANFLRDGGGNMELDVPHGLSIELVPIRLVVIAIGRARSHEDGPLTLSVDVRFGHGFPEGPIDSFRDVYKLGECAGHGEELPDLISI